MHPSRPLLAALAACLSLLFSEVKTWEKPGVPAPEPIQTKATVGVYIFPGWYRDTGRGDYPYKTHDEDSEWKRCVAKVPGPRPLLGFYDDSLPEVNDWHIKWALDHGISYFVFDWYWNAGEKRLARTLERGFLKAKYAPKMKFCINWCNHGLDWKKTTNTTTPEAGKLQFTEAELVPMIEYCAERYFKLPNHLTIDGRPVFMIYELGPVIKACGGVTGFKKAVAAMNAVLRAKQLKDLYLIYMDRWDGEEARAAGLDALTAYVWLGAEPNSPYQWRGGHCLPYAEMPAFYNYRWKQLVASDPPPYLLPIGSDWDNRPRIGKKACFYTGRTPEAFKGMLTNSLRYLDKRMNYALIEAWNEWGEGSYIEPDRKFGFAMLDAVREVFGVTPGPAKGQKSSGAGAHTDWVPPAATVRKYSVLNDEELAAAKAAETNAYPDPPLALKTFTVSVDGPLPSTTPLLAWEFTQGPEDWSSFHLDGYGVQGGVLGGVVAGNDPKIIREPLAVPCAAIGTLAFRLRVSKGPNLGDFFWATAEAPQQTAERGMPFELKPDGEWHVYQLSPSYPTAWSGTLRTLRLDAGKVGNRVEFDWIRLFPK